MGYTPELPPIPEGEPIRARSSRRVAAPLRKRPSMRLVDGVHAGLDWPGIELRAATDRADHEFLFLTGVEPDHAWHSFASAVVDLAPGSAEGVPRLPVDRSFVLRGFGTVVTGTLVSGTLSEGDEIEVLPGRRKGRIRGLQVHGRKADRVSAGRRAAVTASQPHRPQTTTSSAGSSPSSSNTDHW